MKAQVNITPKNEKNLVSLKDLLSINRINLTSKEQLINKAIELVIQMSQSLDEESLKAITGLKKKWS